MLTHIHIRDLATIAEMHLHLASGLTIITGETGAGKSIFIEAIELALGARGSAHIIRPGKERAEISLCFDVVSLPKVLAWLKAQSLEQETECIIRRILNSDGRSRSYINGTPVPLQLVRELSDLLFHLHAQHEQQGLLKTENQRDILDYYANHLSLVTEVAELANEGKTLQEEIRQLTEKTAQRNERSEFLRFQLSELQPLQSYYQAWRALEAEHHKLTHAEELIRNVQHVLSLLAEDEHRNALKLLTDTRKALEAIYHVDHKTAVWMTTLDSIHIQITDLENELRNYLETTELDPHRLHELDAAISKVFTLARKYKTFPQELVALETQLSTELNSLTHCDTDLLQLEEKQKNTLEKYTQAAEKLSKSREKAALKLATFITQTMRSLALPHAEFAIMLEKNTTPFSPEGLEKIVFHIKTNPDHTLQILPKVVSGGELSRLSLSAHLALTHQQTIPTLIFDEIDTGVGGATAEKIGKLLRELGKSYQVFCITHQPQVATYGHHHILVEKRIIQNTAHTELRELNPHEKTTEIARMLGGEKITAKTLEHAQEMLEQVV